MKLKSGCFADRRTKLLRQEFYRSREARNGESKIAALRERKLKLLRGAIWNANHSVEMIRRSKESDQYSQNRSRE